MLSALKLRVDEIVNQVEGKPHSDDALDRPLSTYNYASLRIIHIEKAIADIGGEETFKDLIEGIALPVPPLTWARIFGLLYWQGVYSVLKYSR